MKAVLTRGVYIPYSLDITLLSSTNLYSLSTASNPSPFQLRKLLLRLKLLTYCSTGSWCSNCQSVIIEVTPTIKFIHQSSSIVDLSRILMTRKRLVVRSAEQLVTAMEDRISVSVVGI